MTEEALPNTAHIAQMMTSTLQAMAVSPGSDEEDIKMQQMAAAMALGALEPQDALEALTAARAVAAHFAAMDLYRRAARPGVADPMALKLIAGAASLCRLTTQTAKAMERRKEINRALRAQARAANASATKNGGQQPMSSERQPGPPNQRAHPRMQHPTSSESGPPPPVAGLDRMAAEPGRQHRAG